MGATPTRGRSPPVGPAQAHRECTDERPFRHTPCGLTERVFGCKLKKRRRGKWAAGPLGPHHYFRARGHLMAFIPTTNGIAVRLRYLLHGEECVNVLNFINFELHTTALLTTLGETVNISISNNLMPHLSQDIDYLGCVVRSLTLDVGPQVDLPLVLPVGGGAPSPALPGSVAFVVTHRTSLIGRSWRGRTYVPGLPDSAVTGNEVAGAFAGSVAAAFNQLRADTAPIGSTFSVISYQTGGAPRPAGAHQAITVSEARDLTVDSQRRRLR